MYWYTKFRASTFVRSNVMKGSQILNLGHVTMTMPTLGVILSYFS